MNVVPARTKLAAKRAFIRTTAQAYAGAIPTGISAAALASSLENPQPVQLAAVAIAWVAGPPLAGAASYLSILSRGIPDEYAAARE